jgi:hypothetical protein
VKFPYRRTNADSFKGGMILISDSAATAPGRFPRKQLKTGVVPGEPSRSLDRKLLQKQAL